MTYADIMEELGLTFRAANTNARLAMMVAHARFYLYNPALLKSPLSVAEHLHEAQEITRGKSRGRYEFTFRENSPFWDPKYSEVVLLTQDEGQEFLDYCDKAREYEKTQKTNTPAYRALVEAFEDLKSTYLERVPRNTLFGCFNVSLEQN
jgi:hypothetical protein